MKPHRHRPSAWIVLAAAVGCLAAGSNPAAAGFNLNAEYSGTVVGVFDTYGVFGAITPGDSVGGVIRYSVPEQPPVFEDPFYAFYDFPVTPDGSTLMTATVGGLTLQSTQNLFVQTYNFGDPDFIFGSDFQFGDGDVSLLNTAGLPAGYTLSFLGAYVGLFGTDPTLFDFPTPPSAVLPLSQYDTPFTGGFLFVVIQDGQGQFVDSAFVDFRLTAVTAVPAPPTVALAAAGLPLAAAWVRRRSGRVGSAGGRSAVAAPPAEV